MHDHHQQGPPPDAYWNMQPPARQPGPAQHVPSLASQDLTSADPRFASLPYPQPQHPQHPHRTSPHDPFSPDIHHTGGPTPYPMDHYAYAANPQPAVAPPYAQGQRIQQQQQQSWVGHPPHSSAAAPAPRPYVQHAPANSNPISPGHPYFQNAPPVFAGPSTSDRVHSASSSSTATGAHRGAMQSHTHYIPAQEGLRVFGHPQPSSADYRQPEFAFAPSRTPSTASSWTAASTALTPPSAQTPRQHQPHQQQPQPAAQPPARKPSASTKKAPRAPKRARTMLSPSEDSDYDNDNPTAPSSNRAQRRLPGACTACKKVKMRCIFPKGADTCEKCQQSGKQCVVEGRRPRAGPKIPILNAPPSSKREWYQAQLRDKDRMIETLLKQLHNPYTATPLAVAGYQAATSPRDAANPDVLAWLHRMQESITSASPSTSRHHHSPLSRERAASDSTLESDAVQTLPDEAVPIGLFAGLSLGQSKARRMSQTEGVDVPLPPSPEQEGDVGIANEGYFLPGPAYDMDARRRLIEEGTPPELLLHNLMTKEDIESLFELYHTRLNAWVPLLDPALHTPDLTFKRSPFLFSVICAVTCRYHAGTAHVYPLAMHFAKKEAADALIHGFKSVELAQAFIIMAMYSTPARRWEEDRSWLYAGLAIRIAVDIGLQSTRLVKPKNEAQDRELLNRFRLWMICFDTDWAMAAHWGKPSTMKDNHIIRSSTEFYTRSQFNLPSDIGLCAYNMLLRLVSKFHEEIYSDADSPTGLNKNIDYQKIVLRYDAEMTKLYEEWVEKFAQHRKQYTREAEIYIFRTSLWPYCLEYSRLILLSFGFQQAFVRGLKSSDSLLFNKCLEAAKAVVTMMTDKIVHSGYVRYAPDGWFDFASFAAAYLLKCLKPEFRDMNFITANQEQELLALIDKLIREYTSERVPIDDRHTPKIYGRFFVELIAKYRRDRGLPSRQPSERPSSSGSSSQGPPPSMTHVFSVRPPEHDPFAAPHPPEPAPAPHVHIPGQEEPTFQIEHYAPWDFTHATQQPQMARIQAISNPGFWDNMMMPGFSWTDQRPPSPMDQQPGGGETEWQQQAPFE